MPVRGGVPGQCNQNLLGSLLSLQAPGPHGLTDPVQWGWNGIDHLPLLFRKCVYLCAFGCPGSPLLRRAPLVAAVAATLCGVWASRCGGFSCCRARTLGAWASVAAAPGPRAQAQKLWHTGLVGPQHVGSSQIRDGTCVSCIGKEPPGKPTSLG